MIGQNLRTLRKERNLTLEQLANNLNERYQDKERTVNFNKGKLSKWENNKDQPYLSSARLLADYFGVTVDMLMGREAIDVSNNISTIYNQLNSERQTKVYSFAEHQLEEQNYVEEHYEEYHGQTAAGAPIEGQQPIPFVGAKTVSLLVNGDSMEPKFYDGDIIDYHPQPELENGEIGVFAVNGGITMKKFRRNSDVRLESLNKKYEDIIIKETDDFSILGKVII